jgi:Skp family chaperone for outer membrane proteins
MKSHLLAAIAGGLLAAGLCLSAAQAQTRPAGTTPGYRPTAPPTGVGLLDLSRVFKQYVAFQKEMDDMKADVDRAEEHMKQQTESLKQMAMQLQERKPGSPDYKQLEADLTKRRSDLQVQMQLMRKQFLEREADIYDRHYKAIQNEVSYFASQQNLAAVLRFNKSEADATNPQDVLGKINQPIVWHNPAVDITERIIYNLNARVQGTAGRPGVIGPSR